MTQPANLILFQSDNHNRDLMGAYGHALVQTPTMDRIANGGARFTRAYAASPLCCPSRAALACGRYPHQTGYWDNSLAYDGRADSWAKRLRDQGHTVVSIGKLHFRSAEDDNGFSEEIAPMHIVDGVGGVIGLLRWSDEEPTKNGQWELYADETGIGGTKYQDYDREITRLAMQWLAEEAPKQTRPWVLYVSYVSSHPPVTVPERLWNQYPEAAMPLPVAFRPGERPEHPSLQHARRVFGWQDMTDETMLRRVAAGYCALVTHLDEQMGQVVAAAEGQGLLDTTRLAYTSDHGESYGHHGLFGKSHLLEPAAAVPFALCGPGIAPGQVIDQMASHVDLYPTIVEGAGGHLTEVDADLPGTSLWPALSGQPTERLGFAEYHATASRAGAYMLRQGDWKLIYHVGMPAQLFDLAADPHELRDLVADGSGTAKARELAGLLRSMLDPEAVDQRAKADQRAQAERVGGNDAIRKRGAFVYTPPPGVSAEFKNVQ